MSKHDTCHEDVAAALRREGWHVENEPQRRYKTRLVNFDLRASRDGQTTFIEVKCFPMRGIPDEQYVAIGQYLTYRTFLRLTHLPDMLYLAVPSTIYEKRFDEVLRETLKEHRIKLLIFDETGERSLQWIE